MGTETRRMRHCKTLRLLTRLRRDRRGQVMLLTAVGMTVILGLAGLVLDGGTLYFQKRLLQIAADAGAVGGAWEVVRGYTDLASQIRPAALNDAANNGYTSANATITVNNPPASGPSAGNSRFVEVIIDRSVATTFMRILNFTSVTVRARAVAGAVNIGDSCVVALNRTAPAALNIRGTAEITANCGAISNSEATNGFQTDGNADVTFDWAGVSGYYVDNGGAGTMTPTPDEEVPPILDPLSYLQPPDYSTWPAGFYDAATMTYKCPGNQCVFSARLEVAGPPGLKHFDPGIYVLRDGMDIQSTNVVRGSEVMFYNTGEGFGFRAAGSSDVEFSAPTSGIYKGILFYTNPSAPYLVNDFGTGGADFRWTGTIYTPSQGLFIEGTPLGANPWALMVADTVDFGGTSSMTFNAPPSNQAPELLRVALAE